MFHTRSLVEKNIKAPAWMENNTFNVLLWVVKKLTQNADYIDKDNMKR